MSIGKVNKNGTFNNGAFYSIPDVNTLVENSIELPTPKVTDAGKPVVVDAEGKYALGEAGVDVPEPTIADSGKAIVVDSEGKYALGEAGADLPTPTVSDSGKAVVVDAEGKYALGEAGADLPTPTVADSGKAVVVDAEGNYTLGEAGGSDLKFINVTFVNSGENTRPYAVQAFGIQDTFFGLATIIVAYGSPITIPLLASDGGLRLNLSSFSEINNEVSPVISGNAILNIEKLCFDISGECTITLSGLIVS